MQHIIVAGAGIVGLAVCNALLEQGCRVTLLDANAPGSGTSAGNAGLIADYATTPLSNPDSLRAMLRELTRRRPALTVKPRYLAALGGFGQRFLQAMASEAFNNNKQTLVDLVSRGTALQKGLLESLNSPGLYQQTGCLQIFRDSAITEQQLAALADAKRRDGVACEALAPKAVLALEPALNAQGLTGGLWYSNTWSLRDPQGLCVRLFRQLQRRGLEYVPSQLDRLTPYEDRVQVLAGGQTLGADAVVLCAGLGNQALLAPLGVNLPVVSERGYHLMLDRQQVTLNRPVGWLSRYFYATPMDQGIRIAGTTQFARPDAPAAQRRYRHMQEWAASLFGQPVSVSSQWMGVRHSTPDSLPVIGQLPGHKRITLAFGHGHLGMTLAAITGRLVADCVAGRQTDKLLASLSPSRFL
ncbi:FAD-binding oxidoreductase [Oceanimonas sp. MB9]|uniref:NAD(P)/FAD-dependent oxidoreductase n=1 Tax=Oceanimonas sp. MB9 TaxID=2588453 RepID=UPI0013F6080D|nr:FAD-dependent oxidoreductase [Oceanimonas sp. MB9]NHI00446.1 D-amino acid dehydrogenase 1 [Oceanimonas sp. MB9]